MILVHILRIYARLTLEGSGVSFKSPTPTLSSFTNLKNFCYRFTLEGSGVSFKSPTPSTLSSFTSQILRIFAIGLRWRGLESPLKVQLLHFRPSLAVSQVHSRNVDPATHL